MKVLIFVEQRDGTIKANAQEALTIGRKLAGNSSDVAAVVVGKDVAIEGLDGFGADKVYSVNGEDFANYNVISYTAAVDAAVKDFSPNLVIAAASPMGRDVMPRLAARNDAGIITDVVDIQAEGDAIVATKPMYAGKCLADIALEKSALQIVSIRPNVFAPEKSGDGSATVENLAVSIGSDINLKTTEIRKGESQRADLTEAVRIISGGRAMGAAEKFSILEECADVLGATVGASRAAVDSGYAPHDMQVGQTGKVVNPNLYIACGISGSIQHLAGMRTSKVIVAINTDPEAPIFAIADYGIVADLFEAVPVLTEKLKGML